MEKIIKQFQYTSNCNDIETIYNIKAIVKCSYFSNFRLKIDCIRFENNEIKTRTSSETYFKTIHELIKEYKFQYMLSKNSLYTKTITKE